MQRRDGRQQESTTNVENIVKHSGCSEGLPKPHAVGRLVTYALPHHLRRRDGGGCRRRGAGRLENVFWPRKMFFILEGNSDRIPTTTSYQSSTRKPESQQHSRVLLIVAQLNPPLAKNVQRLPFLTRGPARTFINSAACKIVVCIAPLDSSCVLHDSCTSPNMCQALQFLSSHHFRNMGAERCAFTDGGEAHGTAARQSVLENARYIRCGQCKLWSPKYLLHKAVWMCTFCAAKSTCQDLLRPASMSVRGPTEASKMRCFQVFIVRCIWH